MLEQDPQKMKWKLALRIATSPSERWLKKAAEWRPVLSSRKKTNRAIGRPRKRDGKMTSMISSNKLMKKRKMKNPIGRSNQTNKNWINIAKDWRRWALLERDYTMTV